MMKKLITLFALSTAFVCSYAQISITNADMPMVDDTFRLSTAFDAQGLDPALTGANYSWDFSTLVPSAQRIDTFFSVASTPFAYQLFFNNPFSPQYYSSYATRGLEFSVPQVVSFTEVMNYIKNTSSAYDNVGFGANINGLPASVQNNPIDKEYVFPLNYNNTNTSSSEYEITVPALGHYGQKTERTNTVDGWGTLFLPNDTFNVLRVKSVLTKTDTVYVDQLMFGYTIPRPEEIEYKWLAAGKGMPVLKIITNLGFVTQVAYQDKYYHFVSIKEQPKMNNVVVFPNPTKHYLTVNYNSTVSGNLKVYLKDMLGSNVEVVYQNFSPKGSNKLIVNLAQHNIKPGIYFMKLMVDSELVHTEKVVVVE